ncbi:MAG: hypothetical protein OEX08_03285 [Candidatus Nomurabacteria bacterium]|nr:hypothetical protein [Candidatus Nomurabacteria bacterium]
MKDLLKTPIIDFYKSKKMSSTRTWNSFLCHISKTLKHQPNDFYSPTFEEVIDFFDVNKEAENGGINPSWKFGPKSTRNFLSILMRELQIGIESRWPNLSHFAEIKTTKEFKLQTENTLLEKCREAKRKGESLKHSQIFKREFFELSNDLPKHITEVIAVEDPSPEFLVVLELRENIDYPPLNLPNLVKYENLVRHSRGAYIFDRLVKEGFKVSIFGPSKENKWSIMINIEEF